LLLNDICSLSKRLITSLPAARSDCTLPLDWGVDMFEGAAMASSNWADFTRNVDWFHAT
jgi:hypothetical protein